MRKTTAVRTVIVLVNVAFLVIAATAVISFIPPAYQFSPSPIQESDISSGKRYSMSYTVTNNGFYAIGNLYVGITIRDPLGELVNKTETTPASIQRGTSLTGTITVDVNQTYINSHHGTYEIKLTIHSEFAYGLLKSTIEVPLTTSL